MAFLDKEVNVVSVGHKMKQHEIGRANLYLTKYKFMQEVKEEDKALNLVQLMTQKRGR